jgi:protein-tyrosine phosphatase
MNSRTLTHLLKPLLLAAVLLLSACQQAAAPQAKTTAASVESVLKDQRRVLALDGGKNFRDLGGYRTADGMAVKWRVLFRSGDPSGLTPADEKKLASYGIRTVCDLRDNAEREDEPNRWAEHAGLDYWTRDYAMDLAPLADALRDPQPTPAKSHAGMLALYRLLPEEQAESYAAMFGKLVDGKLPLAFNCSAGKDRTGVAAALILHALGVPRETILADYALSDEVVDYRAELQKDAKTSESAAHMAAMPWPVIEPLMASDPAYLREALSAIERRHSSLDGYLEKRLGLTQDMRASLRRQLLEPA